MEELISQKLGFFLISPTEKLERNTSPEELCQQFQRQQRWKKSTRKVCKGLNHGRRCSMLIMMTKMALVKVTLLTVVTMVTMMTLRGKYEQICNADNNDDDGDYDDDL